MTAKVICINNNKGGVLKTTTTTNLAGVLSSKGYKVLIVDADNQGNATMAFGVDKNALRTTIYDVLAGGVPPEDAIINVHNTIDLLPSNRELISFEFDVIGDTKSYPEPFKLMTNALSHLKEVYDFILIDTPPSLGLMNGNVFTFTDHVVIPYAPELYSMDSLVEVVHVIRDFKQAFNPNLEILGVLRTLVNIHTNLHSGIIQETNRYACENDIHVFDTVIPNTIQFSNAVAFYERPATIVYDLLKGSKRIHFNKAGLYFKFYEEFMEKLEVEAK
ncbi:AAA family ATPase [Bacillus cereus group sp. TH36-2LC]|uniref:ParA family protein n=1 Tax=Bacillus cereus group sp. TH36-2LC TaxID=3018040 RepID=UPI0022E86936|nr:AAA family ATPase [Bacillus cereus group sp. TH36-2LC]MDA1509616.1 AAA family ATPase [Bacillus cereus group sp. TH36-2LC]